MRAVILLRHGRTAWNAQRRFQGQADPPLDDVGRMQAYEVAQLIAALRPGLLVSSDSARAMQTPRSSALPRRCRRYRKRGCVNAGSGTGRG